MHEGYRWLDAETFSSEARGSMPLDTLWPVAAPNDEMVRTRTFRAGSLTFVVQSPDPKLADLAERLFQDLPTPSTPALTSECFVLSASSGDSEHELYDLECSSLGAVTHLPLAAAVRMLVSGVSRAALDAEPHRLHLHAAGAALNGRAVILAAPRETGKTTTVVRLALRGWDLISDEMLSITDSAEHVQGFGKPVSIKPGSRELLPELAPYHLPDHGVSEDSVVHVPLGVIGAAIREEAVPRVVILLRRTQTSGSMALPTSRPIHPVDAVVGLMQETLDADRYGSGAVLALAHLATRCACLELTVGDLTSTVGAIERVFGESEVPPLLVEHLPRSSHIAPEVESVRIGDRVVIHERASGKILALDAAATRIWLKAGGWDRTEEIDLAGPVVSQFVDELISLGLIGNQP